MFSSTTLMASVTARAERLEASGRLRSAEICRSLCASIGRYEGACGRDRGIDAAWIRGYEDWLLATGITSNTSSFYMRALRAACRRVGAPTEGFDRVYTGVGITAPRALDRGMLRCLRDTDLDAKPSRAFARDMFMLSFYLRGMSFVDMARLACGVEACGVYYRRAKTGVMMHVAWEPEMQAIVDRMTPGAGGRLLPIVMDVNDAAGERRDIYRCLQRVNRSLIKVGEALGFPVRLTTYVARHTWATLARDSDVPLSVISAALGHASERTTRIYLDSLDHGRVDRANRRLLDILK